MASLCFSLSLCFGLLALFLAFSPPLLGMVVAIAAAAVEQRLLIIDLSFPHYFYPGTYKFYSGTGPGMPGCSYTTGMAATGEIVKLLIHHGEVK